jgi:hypothetical protein
MVKHPVLIADEVPKVPLTLQFSNNTEGRPDNTVINELR